MESFSPEGFFYFPDISFYENITGSFDPVPCDLGFCLGCQEAETELEENLLFPPFISELSEPFFYFLPLPFVLVQDVFLKAKNTLSPFSWK